MRGDDHGTTRVRRWPTRRHRRNRLIRRIAAEVLIVFFGIGLFAVALNYLSPSLTRSSEIKNAIHWEAVDARKLRLTSEPTPRPNAARMRPVYPYSVVPGGVEDARELKWVAEHDPIVAEHYRGFDYDHARVVRLALAQTVFVSYRVGNHVYWTRHRITLHKGEKLITDGKITARARCANRVEELPQQLHSAPEPAVAEFEEPIGPSQGSSMAIPPVEFESALLNRPGIPGAQALPPLSLYSVFPVGSGVSISPPPLPSGVCAPVKKPGKGEVAVFGEMSKKKKPTGPCGSVGGTAPEPGTWLLLITGLIAVGWIARRRAIVV